MDHFFCVSEKCIRDWWRNTQIIWASVSSDLLISRLVRVSEACNSTGTSLEAAVQLFAEWDTTIYVHPTQWTLCSNYPCYIPPKALMPLVTIVAQKILLFVYTLPVSHWLVSNSGTCRKCREEGMSNSLGDLFCFCPFLTRTFLRCLEAS